MLSTCRKFDMCDGVCFTELSAHHHMTKAWFVFPCAGIPIDGKTVFTSDHALKLDWLPNWVAIIGSGYIGLEFSDVYTALGTEVGSKQAHKCSVGTFLLHYSQWLT